MMFEIVPHILQYLKVHEVGGYSKTRIGRCRDGGYVMLDDFREITRAYSLGVADEVTWDLAIAAMGIPVEMYDGSIEEPPEKNELFDFHPNWVGIELFSNLAHGRDNILKADIEGAEWTIMQNADFSPYRQMAWELHGLGALATEEGCRDIGAALSRVNQTHVVVHVHGNNNGEWVIVGGVPCPETLEVTWVRRRDYWIRESDEILPGPHDQPNNPGLPDMRLGRLF